MDEKISPLVNFTLFILTPYIPYSHGHTHTLNVMSRRNRNPLQFILLTHDHKMSIYAYFSDSRIAPRVRLSQIHLHDTSKMFISTSKFSVSIVTLKNIGECQSICLSITYAILHQVNLKIYYLQVSHPKFPAISVHSFYRIAKSKSPLCPKLLIGQSHNSHFYM